jgi:hypothetical protein
MTIDDELLAQAAGVTDEQLAGLELGPAPRPASRRRRRLVAVGAGLAAVVAVGVPAAAGGLGAHTGVVGRGGEDGHSERLRLDAPDIGAVYAEYTSRHPLPPGGSWDPFLARMTRPDAELGEASEEVVAQWVAWEARCQWERAWLRGEPAAQDTLDAMTTWPEFTANDADGQGAKILRRIAATTRAGDDTALKQDLKANCS